MKMLKMLVQEKKKGRENAREKILIVKQEWIKKYWLYILDVSWMDIVLMGGFYYSNI